MYHELRKRGTSRAQLLLIAALITAAVALTAWHKERRTAEIFGVARVIDGDSIVVAGVEIRIFGIDAPEYRQFCHLGQRAWACGIEATKVMQTMVVGRDVHCRPRELDRYGRTVAVCFVGDRDIGAAMVKGGYAVAYGAYAGEEREARDARRGIWASSFERPADWRARHRRHRHRHRS